MSYPYPYKRETLSDYLRQERVKRGLEQKDLIPLLGVCEATISNWERHVSEPRLKHIPKIITFLGYDPFPIEGDDLISEVKRYQRRTGYGLNRIAGMVGMDSGYLSHVMNGHNTLGKEKREKLLVAIGHE